MSILEDSAQENKILLIVNESYGHFKDNKINNDIVESILKNKKLMVDSGSFFYSGVTIGGEFRELCNKNSRGIDFKVLRNSYGTCIPNILSSQGFETLAYHGGGENFYNRVNWYPKVGFKSQFFDKNFPKLPKCKAFNGLCDHDLMPIVLSKLFNNKKKFVYWLTINTHEPYDEIVTDDNRINCFKYGLNSESEVCKNIKLQTQFFDQLAILLKKNDMKNVKIYIVGDHPPPIWNKKEKKLFMDGAVSWVKITNS